MATKGITKEQTGIGVKLPKKYQVLIYNDDFTPMEFVVEVLKQIFDKSEEEAVKLMLQIHKGNFAVIGIYPRDLAQTKAGWAMQWAKREGYPLKVEAVSE